MLTWDSSYYYANAIRMTRRTETDGVAGFASGWVQVSPTHAPLVPALSGLAMLMFGENRGVAMIVLPVFIFIFFLSVARCVQILYPPRSALESAIPHATAALAFCFPVFLNVSRIYLFEFPLAALTAASCWGLLSSQYFTKLAPSLIFGVVGGLAAVTRAGGPALLAGPVLVVIFISLRRAFRVRTIINILAAGIVSVGIAATWYWPNWSKLYEYIYSVTYGNRAEAYTMTGTSLSLRATGWLFWGSVIDGPGAPAVAFGILLYAWRAIRERSFMISPVIAALAAAFAIDFCIVIPATQQPGGILLLAILPIASIMLIRAAMLQKSETARSAAVIITLLFGAHHLYALTWGFEKNESQKYGFGPFSNIQIWNHRNSFLDIAGASVNETRLEEAMTAVAMRLNEANVSDGAFVHLLVDNPFFQANNLTLEALSLGRTWTAVTLNWIAQQAQIDGRVSMRNVLLYSEAIVVRTPPNGKPDRYDEMVDYLTKPIFDGPGKSFTQFGGAIPYFGGSVLKIYKRDPLIEWKSELPAYFTKIDAAFRSTSFKKDEPPEIRLAGYAYQVIDGGHRAEFALEFDNKYTNPPNLQIHILRTDRKFVAGPRLQWSRPGDPPRPPGGRFLIYRTFIDPFLPPKLHERGFLLMVAIGGNDRGQRYLVESTNEVEPTERRVVIVNAAPDGTDMSPTTTRPR